ncbi:hypothetical protein BDV93DRAFT_566687 [Ceratobasidium sp. AG-I]|nr:hypothetical protein BDV93DRAFT_566687 [Ceratobasidium sp. AG-I]
MPRPEKQRAARQTSKPTPKPKNPGAPSLVATASPPTGLRAQLNAKQAEMDALQAELEEFRQNRIAENDLAQAQITAAEEERNVAVEERNAAEQQLAAIPAAPIPPVIPIDQVPPMLNIRLPSGNDIITGCVGTSKIAKPKGSAGKNWNLKAKMGMAGFDTQYKAIHRTVLRLVANAHLNPSVEFRRQDPLLIGAICRAALEEHPFLSRFILPATWPALEMIKVLLRNQRAYIVAQGGHHSVTDLPLQNLNIGGGLGGDDDDF